MSSQAPRRCSTRIRSRVLPSFPTAWPTRFSSDRHLLVGNDDLVKIVGDLSGQASPGDGEPDAEIAVLHRLQALKDDGEVLRLGVLPVGDRRIGRRHVGGWQKILSGFPAAGLLHGDFQRFGSCRRGFPIDHWVSKHRHTYGDEKLMRANEQGLLRPGLESDFTDGGAAHLHFGLAEISRNIQRDRLRCASKPARWR